MSTFGSTGAPARDFAAFVRSFDVVKGPITTEGAVRMPAPLIFELWEGMERRRWMIGPLCESLCKYHPRSFFRYKPYGWLTHAARWLAAHYAFSRRAFLKNDNIGPHFGVSRRILPPRHPLFADRRRSTAIFGQKWVCFHFQKAFTTFCMNSTL